MSNRTSCGMWVLLPLLWLSLAHSALAQTPQAPDTSTTLEQRVQELEAQVRQLQATVPATASSNATEAATTGAADGTNPSTLLPVAGWDQGFFLSSPGKDYVLRFTGQIQADYRAYLRGADTTDIDEFFLRRARFGVDATMANYYEFRFLSDFGQGQPRIQDAFFNLHYCDEIQFMVGKFKQPFSYEEFVIADRFVPTLERSMIDQLTPARDVGVMIHGEKLWGDRFEYGVSLSNGEINGDGDTNNHSDFNVRAAVRPFNDPDLPAALRGLQLGLSYGFGVENEPVNPSILKTPATVPWFQFNSTVQASGVRTRLSPELAYYYGSLGFAAQYMDQQQELRPAASGPSSKYRNDVGTRGYYVLLTYLVTGEQRIPYTTALEQQFLQPLAPFDFRHPFTSPGAWEPLVRLSRLQVDNDVFEPGLGRLADPTKESPGATELTVGFNWYFNKWVRVQFNLEHAWFDQPVQLGSGPSGRIKSQDTLMTRFQIVF